MPVGGGVDRRRLRGRQHYDNRTRLVATITTVLAYTAYTAGQFAAAAAMLQVLLGWDYGYALLLSGAIVIL